jgi:hypothetical protein
VLPSPSPRKVAAKERMFNIARNAARGPAKALRVDPVAVHVEPAGAPAKNASHQEPEPRLSD